MKVGAMAGSPDGLELPESLRSIREMDSVDCSAGYPSQGIASGFHLPGLAGAGAGVSEAAVSVWRSWNVLVARSVKS